MKFLALSMLMVISTSTFAQTKNDFNVETMNQWYKARVVDMDAAIEQLDDVVISCTKYEGGPGYDGLYVRGGCLEQQAKSINSTIAASTWQYNKLRELISTKLGKYTPYYNDTLNYQHEHIYPIQGVHSDIKSIKRELLAIRDNMKENISDARGTEALKQELRDLKAENRILTKLLNRK